jgi:hypothetical protein
LLIIALGGRILLTIALRRPILLVIALGGRIPLIIALRRAILLVISLGRGRAISVGRTTIARPIIGRWRRRWWWARCSPKYGKRQRRKGQRTDNGATDEAGTAVTVITAAPVIATMPERSAVTPAGVCG